MIALSNNVKNNDENLMVRDNFQQMCFFIIITPAVFLLNELFFTYNPL